ncbi:MAG: hypothetical protein WC549_07545 [Actinomycetota bacterium]
MCKWGTEKTVKLYKAKKFSRRIYIEVDRCIADIVQALNDAKIPTTFSCCGHLKGNGSILLEDGRELIIKKWVLPDDKIRAGQASAGNE